jgi:DNA ligase-1
LFFQLFGGRGKFQSTVSIVKTTNSPKWKDITFQVRLFTSMWVILSLTV